MLLDRIELFVNVAKDCNLAKTARGMHVSPSSVSQRLKSLEKDFGARLYRRTKNGIELTYAGRALLSTANQVLHQLQSLRRTLNPYSEKRVQTLSVGGTFTPSAKHLPSAIAAFQKSHPEIQITFLTSHRPTVEKWTRDGEVELAIVQSPSKSCIAELCAEPFAVDTLAFFAHAGHPLAKKQKISFEELANTPLIVREAWEPMERVLALVRSRGLKLNVALRCDSPDAVKAAVRAKMGIGILFHDLIEEDIRRKELKILRIPGLPRMSARSYIVYDKTKPLNHPATEFLALLRYMKTQQKKPIDIPTKQVPTNPKTVISDL
jgi:LysR family transcriptional regulator, transcriptional activator of the cysJI operon